MRCFDGVGLLVAAVTVGSLACGSAKTKPTVAGHSAAGSSAVPSQPLAEVTEPTLRLPDHVVPLRVRAELSVVPSEVEFRGMVEIDVEVKAPTDRVWLNATNLKFKQASVSSAGKTLIATTRVVSDDFVELKVDGAIPVGKATIAVSYRGSQEGEKTEGLYRVAEPDGTFFSYTMFEPIMARRVFPIFDEPAHKIPWTLSLRVKDSHVAATNTSSVKTVNNGDGTKSITFGETKPLPSYLIAFMVGPFDVVEAGTVAAAKVPLRFILPPGHRDELGYAKEVTPRIVAVLEKMIGIPYPFAKLDVAVVPRFWGTMEHPGIVALGQPLTLIKPSEDTLADRKSYANIAIHELCHYWFGDLVTMSWWNDLWLNESFGTWCDEKATALLEPSWNYDVASVASMRSAFYADQFTSVKRLSEPAESKGDVESSTSNSITYNKGAAVIRTFEHFVGEAAFGRAIKEYLSANAWGSATAETLATSLNTEQPGLGDAFQTFVNQAGAPQVSMKLMCSKGQGAKLALEQQRFVPVSSLVNTKMTWQVPVCVRYGTKSTSHRECTLLKSQSATIQLAANAECPTWFLGNAGGVGYYRSVYDSLLTAKVQRAFDKHATNAEIYGVASDQLASLAAGRSDVSDVMQLLPRLMETRSAAHTWLAMGLFRTVEEMVPTGGERRFKQLIRKTFGSRARQLGWRVRANELADATSQRGSLLGLLGTTGNDAKVRREAERLTRSYLKDATSIAPDLASTIHLALGISAYHGDERLYDAFLAAARRAKNHDKRRKLLSRLGYFRDAKLLKRTLELVLSDEFDLRDTRGAFRIALQYREFRPRLWRFVTENFDALAKRMTGTYLKYFLVGPSSFFCDADGLAKAQAFYTSERLKPYPGTELHLRNELDQIRYCIAYRERHHEGVAKYFGSR